MAWRVLENGEDVWHVQAAAEKRPESKVWQLVLAFRQKDVESEPHRFWAPYPLEADSKSSLYQAADRLSDDAIREILVRHLS